MNNENLIDILTNSLKERNNPVDLKPAYVGKIISLEPISVSIFSGEITITENEELYISEQFQKRCEIDKTSALSSDVISLLNNAANVTEIHSNGGGACNMPTAISYLKTAIEKINTELLNLKCDLKIGDYVLIGSLEQQDRFILLDKV